MPHPPPEHRWPADPAGAPPRPGERRTYRVVKTLAPTDRGALLFARQYGAALVCVRHRTDAKGKVRHTTVELLVSSTPIQPRTIRYVLLRLAPHEQALSAMLKAAGAAWLPQQKLWKLPSRVATILNLRSRIVER